MRQNQNKNHIPVLMEAVLKYLDPKPGESYLDLTAGYGGHAEQILKQTKAFDKCVLVDRDESATEHLRQIIGKRVTILNQDLLSACKRMASEGKKFDIILADLGVSSPHLNTADRGFSFRLDGPLDMRMDQTRQLTAEQVVNNYGEQELLKILREYGEEPRATKIARAIVLNRPIKTTKQLADTVVATLARRHSRSKIHPATKTFQAIRIEVNDELNQIKEALPFCKEMLKPGGRIAVISFHSLEDRIVKRYFNSLGGSKYDSEVEILTKRPITGSDKELAINPRARSAKLRAVAKIKTHPIQKIAVDKERGKAIHANTGKKPLPIL